MKFEPNIDALTALPADEKLDAIVAMSPENFTYCSGAHVGTVKRIRPRHAYAVLPAKANPFAVVCSIEETLLAHESWIEDIRTYTEFVDEPVEALAKELSRAGIESGRVGIDLDYLPAASFARLQSATPGIEWVNTTETISKVRAIKSDSEVAVMEAATRSTHRATLNAMEACSLGESEATMAQRIANNLMNHGADGTAFMNFASGARSKLVHTVGQPDVYPEESDIIRFDIGGIFHAFMSDFARTYSAGAPNQAQKQVYRELCLAQKATIEAVRPGVVAEDLFAFCQEEFKRRGLPWKLPHIGHGFGVELHENPMIRPGDKTRLAAGMVLNIEPLTSDDEGWLYHTEDLLVVTEAGHRLLTLGLAPAELPSIGEHVSY